MVDEIKYRITLEVSEGLWTRITECHEKLNKTLQEGIKVSRSDAYRALLEEGAKVIMKR